MKKGAFKFQTVLIIISAFLGLTALASEQFFILAALWWIAFGAIQVIHSVYLGVVYWDLLQFRKTVIIYWAGVVLDLGFLYLSADIDSVIVMSVIVVPIILALFLWLITYVAYEKKPSVPTLEFERQEQKP